MFWNIHRQTTRVSFGGAVIILFAFLVGSQSLDCASWHRGPELMLGHFMQGRHQCHGKFKQLAKQFKRENASMTTQSPRAMASGVNGQSCLRLEGTMPLPKAKRGLVSVRVALLLLHLPANVAEAALSPCQRSVRPDPPQGVERCSTERQHRENPKLVM